jgi:hypothetical protein
VTVGAAAFLPEVLFPEPELGRGLSAGAGRASTVFFEQIGQSAVKRLWRQKSDDIGHPKIRRLPRCLRC